MATTWKTMAGIATFVALACPAVCAWASDTGAGPDAGTATRASSDAGTAGGAAALGATLSQSATPDEPIHPGQTITVKLVVSRPQDTSVVLPDTYTSAHWRLLDEKHDEVVSESTVTETITLLFGIYRPGQTTLDAFPVKVVDRGGATQTLKTKPIEARVVSTLDSKKQPTFGKQRAPVPIWVDDYTLAWLGGGAGFLALSALIAFLAIRRRRLAPPPPAPPRPPHEVALEKLGALAGDDLVERGEYMIFYVRLSEAIREYLGRRWGFPGTELTTTEILGHLEDVVWPNGLSDADIAGFLRHCDSVKFGGAIPGAERANEALRKGFTIVELTKPQPRPAPAQKAAATEEAVDDDAAAVPAQAETASRWAPASSVDDEADGADGADKPEAADGAETSDAPDDVDEEESEPAPEAHDVTSDDDADDPRTDGGGDEER